MRLDFNVLWVEDNQGNVLAQRDAIVRKLRSQGFRLQVQFAASVDEATAYLSNEIYGDHVDLVLMDYDLGPGKHGDQGLAEVRQIVPYKDMVFYSGRQTSDLREMVKAQNVDGVYVASREDLANAVERLFEGLVRKILDIDHSRGIVMGATSDIDQGIRELLYRKFDSCENDVKDKIRSEILKRIAEKEKEFRKSIEKIKAIVNVNELEPHHQVYHSGDRQRLLEKLLKLTGLDEVSLNRFQTYRTEVTPARTILAHVSSETNGFARKVYVSQGGQKRELTAEEMRELRVKLLEFQEFLESV